MPLETADLDAGWQPEVLAYLRRSPYRNALPLSSVTQLRPRCEVVLAHSGGAVQGVAAWYRDGAHPLLALVAELDEALALALAALATRAPALRAAELSTTLPEQRVRRLAACAEIVSLAAAYQMVVEPETLRPAPQEQVRRLRPDDLPAMIELSARGGPAPLWPGGLSHGPAFGAFAGEQLVAMAATHFATPDVVEIGAVVLHPAHRHYGLASACISALAEACFGLAPRVYLMLAAGNEAAFAAYRALGFWPAERFALTTFRLG